MSMEIEEGHHRAASAMAKLELIKEIRSKTDQMYKLKEKLLEEIQNSRKEDQFLVDYRCELEALISEKLSHVEQLRKIHADIDSMESVIKQAEASKTRSIENAKRLHTEFLPVKGEVDRLRQSCLGLERLPDLHEEEPSILSFDLFEPQLDRNSSGQTGQQQQQNWPPPSSQHPHPHPPTPNNGHNLQQQQRDNSSQATNAMLLNYQKQQQQNSVTQAAVAAFMLSQHQNGPNMNMNVNMNLLSRSPPTSNKDGQRQNSLPPSHPNTVPPFRTPQLAPMKKCQSCGHEIHRNAPICPVCKAKSRSRNPKKTKKKN